MGADIHLFIEYKKGDQPWETDKNHILQTEDDYERLESCVASHRNYEVFAALAGVRGEGPDPLGLPDDVTDKVKAESDRWGDDGHSHNYNSLEEFTQIIRDLYNSPEYRSFGSTGFKDDAVPKAFYSSNAFDPNEYRGMNYETLIAYCKEQVIKFKLELEAEAMLLDQPINTNVECRLVYWFDN